MHIQKIEIRNIRAIKSLDMAFNEGEPLAGWHVLIGDNGSGKSTVLKAVALALVGSDDVAGLSESWADWLPEKFPEVVAVGLKVVRHLEDKSDDRFFSTTILHVEFMTMQDHVNRYSHTKTENNNQYLFLGPVDNVHVENQEEAEKRPRRINRLWFSAAYGPYRRFIGDDAAHRDIHRNNQKLAAHLTLFREDAALTEVMSWLKTLLLQEFEAGQPADSLLAKLKAFINHEYDHNGQKETFLPFSVRLEKVTSDGVFFTDANGHTLTVQNLSDGYRSILSLTLDIIRQMQIAYQTDDLFSDDFATVKMPGVVLIDEVDAHLHPTWQRKIGFWFKKHFPNVQFIVTTHSPLICQAAVDGGSVWKLPTPGNPEEACVRVTGQDLNRLLYGNILEAYSTQLFGADHRSEKADEKLERLAYLNIKEVFEPGGLTEAEMREQEELRAMFPLASNKVEQPQ